MNSPLNIILLGRLEILLLNDNRDDSRSRFQASERTDWSGGNRDGHCQNKTGLIAAEIRFSFLAVR